MKHLANCTPMEFQAQAMRFRGPYLRWLDASGARALMNPHGLPAARLDALMSTSLERCPALTREVLALATFTPPGDFDARPLADYLAAAREIHAAPAVRDFLYVTAVAAPGDFFRGLNDARPELTERLGVPYLTDAVIERLEARRRESAWRDGVLAALRSLCAFAGVAVPEESEDTAPIPAEDGLALARARLDAMGIARE